MEPNLFRYIWRHTKREQMWILTIILVSMPIYFLSLELPKRIVNGPIQGEGFDAPGITQKFLSFTLKLPEFLGGYQFPTFPGLELERLPYLVALSLAFLALVCINGLFKFYINTYKGRLGERMLRRVRFELVDRILRFPYGQFRRVKAPEVATMVKDEVEPLGGFIGDAYVAPVFLGGQALTAMGFILTQNVWLGLIAGGIVTIQALLIPRLRRRLLELGKQRQLTARALAGRVGEIVDGIADIRTNDTSNYERAGISDRLSRIFFIRYEFYQRKFFVKFLNNFLAQVTPFLFYLIGGYLAIRGRLDIGQLVAVIAAYKDLPGPIKELIDWDQRRLDVQIKYGQVVDQFTPDDMIEPRLQAPVAGPVDPIAEPIKVENLLMMDDTGARLVEDVSFTIKPGERVAAIGEVNAGGEATAEALARLYRPKGGRILINGTNIEELSEALTGRRTAYVGTESNLQNAPLIDCLLYGLKHAPNDARGDDEPLTSVEISEAAASGNLALNIRQDWIDYEAAGCNSPEELTERVLEVLKLVELDRDVFELGLRGHVSTEKQKEWSGRILDARSEMRILLQQPNLQGLIEPFDPETYNSQATVAGNLMFGTAVSRDFETDALPSNPFIRSTLAEAGLDTKLYEMGQRIAETVIELFADLEPGNPFFDQLTFMTADELPDYEVRLARPTATSFETANEEDQAAFLRLAFAYVEPRHRLGLLDGALKEEILKTRQIIGKRLPAEHEGAVLFYDPDAFNPAASLQDNILFGRMAHGVADGPERIHEAFRNVLDQLDLNHLVFEAGLQFTVGTGGRRLTTSQRQKVNLAKALIKRPDLLIVNRGLSGLSTRNQNKIIQQTLKESEPRNGQSGFAVFWVLMDPSISTEFDRALLFENGRLKEDGKPEQLLNDNSGLVNVVN